MGPERFLRELKPFEDNLHKLDFFSLNLTQAILGHSGVRTRGYWGKFVPIPKALNYFRFDIIFLYLLHKKGLSVKVAKCHNFLGNWLKISCRNRLLKS